MDRRIKKVADAHGLDYLYAMQTQTKRTWSKPKLKDMPIFMEVSQYAASR